jgi:O-antigen biosynthesis protein WbqP
MFNRLTGFILLIVLSPLFLLISLLIFIEDGSPVFFKQKRFGKDASFFWIYKFRSMRKDTPNLPTHLLQDPAKYLLKTGRWLRKLSLDELPNLINIVRGEMVFVGPRPALYNQEDLMEMRRLAGVEKLKPGITGWAQVNGRDELSLDEKVRYEAEYLHKKSFWFDLKIVFLTFTHSLSSKGVAH